MLAINALQKSLAMTMLFVISCTAVQVQCPAQYFTQVILIFATVPNLWQDSANVSNGADGVLVIVVFHGW